jgi:2-phosphosulfolactate phosphatase
MSYFDAILSPPEIDLLPQRDLRGAIAVVFDVLRATSSIVTALSNGASGIRPVNTIEEARDLKTLNPNLLLGGERNGERIEGFDLGNSPLEYNESVRGREIVTTTTNGTVALRAVAHAETILAASLLNATATAEFLSKHPANPVILVCAGTFRDPALEDIYAAGLIAWILQAREMRDPALVAKSVYAANHEDSLALLRSAENGRALIRKGRIREVEWCAQVDTINIVAELKPDGFIRSI